ncbi:hypothetical protein Prum_068810 [Phytohabitans rumicis]|uniref:Uncharacterized protein n=1 Tax=Phytohabitans rumicis TaxID=1076125 RepID=A0A6V8LF51_9ACTN|nr:hypothetical protein Prum_068810 [Phytohabitans rumicis]
MPSEEPIRLHLDAARWADDRPRSTPITQPDLLNPEVSNNNANHVPSTPTPNRSDVPNPVGKRARDALGHTPGGTSRTVLPAVGKVRQNVVAAMPVHYDQLVDTSAP